MTWMKVIVLDFAKNDLDHATNWGKYSQATQAPRVTVRLGFCVSNGLLRGWGASSSMGAGCNGRKLAIITSGSMKKISQARGDSAYHRPTKIMSNNS